MTDGRDSRRPPRRPAKGGPGRGPARGPGKGGPAKGGSGPSSGGGPSRGGGAPSRGGPARGPAKGGPNRGGPSRGGPARPGPTTRRSPERPAPPPRREPPARPAKPRGPVGDPRHVFRRDPSQFALPGQAPGEAPPVDYHEALAAKHAQGIAVLQAAGVLGTAHVLPPVESPRQLGYRALFKLAVRPAKADAPEGERFAIGLFAPGSHEVVENDADPMHVPPLRRLLRDLRQELNASPITPYDEATHTGDLRYLVARAAHLTGEIMLTFVVTTPLKGELRALTQRLVRRGHKINAAHMNLNTEPGNAIMGAETVRIAGADRLRERVCDLDFDVSPSAFFQINPWQAINLYRRVEQLAGSPRGPAVAWDLYCGIGQISLVLARLGYRVLGVEENASAVEDARANARKNQLADRAEFVAARVEDSEDRVPTWAKSPSLIVVNPSRRGLAESTRSHLTWLLKQQPEARFLYVSCEVETLARDLAELTRSGFAVRQVEAFDMFAQTDGMEWLVVMTR